MYGRPGGADHWGETPKSRRLPSFSTGSPWVLHRGAVRRPDVLSWGRRRRSSRHDHPATLSEVIADRLYGVFDMPSGAELIRQIKDQIREVDPREVHDA